MANMIIVAPLAIASIAATRGSRVDNLLTASPKEVWADSAAGSVVYINIDLGAVRAVDTIFLGHVYGAAAAADWTIQGGVAGYNELWLKGNGALRVPDVAGRFAPMTHALWFGAAASVRYLQLAVTQPAGSPPLMVGVLLVGKAFQPYLNREFGAGRSPIDTGTATALVDGGYGIAEGVRKRSYGWTFGDLTAAEVDDLEEIALDRGETGPLLVVEDPAATAGLRTRIHYGLFTKLRAFDRRNAVQTRWEMGMNEWV